MECQSESLPISRLLNNVTCRWLKTTNAIQWPLSDNSGLPVIRQPLQLIAVQTAHPSRQWTNGVPLEDAARQQLLNVAQLPFIYKWVAAMPDVHWGIGATVGSVIPTRGAIIPAAVGVDIGCGMMACRLL